MMIKKEDFKLEKCKTKASYSAKLKKNGAKLDLLKIAEKFEVSLKTKILLVVKISKIEVICHRFGELMFKNCQDVKLMENIALKIYKVGIKE